MFSLYIGNKNYSSWSLRPWLLLTELDIDFEEKLIPFDDGNSWEKFRKFSPTGLVPCLFDGDIQVWESLAIVEYLAEQYSAVWPEDKTARAWARSATAEMHAGFSAIRNQCPMSVGLRIKLHEVSAPLQQDLTRLDELWQQGLDRFGGPFLGGPTFTAVDAFFAPVAYRLQTYALPHAPHAPRAQAYAHHLLSTQGMRAWTDAALKETFREPSHEEEFAQLGVIQKDLRESV